MRSSSFLVILVAVLLSLPTDSGHADGPPGTERYLLLETGKGILRLDRDSGAVSFCRLQGSNYVCKAAADDRLALEREIARLEAENARLRKRLAALGEKLPEERALPSDDEIDRAMDRTERILRRFFGIVEDLKREFADEDGQSPR